MEQNGIQPHDRILLSSINGKTTEVRRFGPTCFKEKEQRQTFGNLYCLLAQNYATHDNEDRFLYRIITSNKKCCFHENLNQRRECVNPSQQPTPIVKLDLHSHKTMICVCCDLQGVILERNKTVNAQLYIQQMKRHFNKIDHLLLFCNMITLGWEILSYNPYFTDPAPVAFEPFACRFLQ